MRILAFLAALSLASSASWAETRITESSDQLLIEITGEPDTAGIGSALPSPGGKNVATLNRNRSAFVDPASADFLRNQIDEIRKELGELKNVPIGESAEGRSERIQRLNEKQRLLQQYSAELSAIRSQSVKRY